MGKLRLMYFPKSTLFSNTEKIVDVPKGVAELDGFCNVLFHSFDHEILIEGMKEEISQQRSKRYTVGPIGILITCWKTELPKRT